MTERARVRGALAEVSLPETTEQEELDLYERYRAFGGRAIEAYETKLRARKDAAIRHGQDSALEPDPL